MKTIKTPSGDVKPGMGAAEALAAFAQAGAAWHLKAVARCHPEVAFEALKSGGEAPAFWLARQPGFKSVDRELLGLLSGPSLEMAVAACAEERCMRVLRSLAVCMQFRSFHPERATERLGRKQEKLARRLSKIVESSGSSSVRTAAIEGVMRAREAFLTQMPTAKLWIDLLDLEGAVDSAVARAERRAMRAQAPKSPDLTSQAPRRL